MGRRTEWFLFFLLFFSSAYFRHPVEYDNTLSRYFLLSAAVDYRRLDLGMFQGETCDVSVWRGRIFSNKAIGLPLLAWPAYGFLRRWTPMRLDPPLSERACYLTRLWAVSLPFALSGVVLYWLLLNMGLRAWDAWLSVLGYAFGTIAWIHSSLFSGHQTAASFSLFALAAVWALSEAKAGAFWPWLGAGMLAGLGGLCDYLSMLAIFPIGWLIWRRSHSCKNVAAFGAGVALWAAIAAAYNWRCFGAPWSISYAHQEAAFAEGANRGVLGVSLPSLETIAALLFSPARGLFFIMPIFLMALPGFFQLIRKGGKFRDAAVACAAIPLAALFVHAGYFGWHGGWTFGPRYLASSLPFLMIPTAFGLDRRWWGPLFFLSFIQILAAQFVMPHVPQDIVNPLRETLLPLASYGYWADNLGSNRLIRGIWSVFPWAVVAAGLAWLGRPRYSINSQKSSLWALLYGGGIVAIMLAMPLSRSPNGRQVHAYNAKLLRDAHERLQAQALENGAMKEDALRAAR